MPAANAAGQRQVPGGQLESQLPANARWALTVIDLKSGRETTMGNADGELLTPGSLTKLFIAGAVLERTVTGSPPDLTTMLTHDGELRDGTLRGNLYLQGRGNALLTPADLRVAATRLAEQDLKRISGDVVVDPTLFDARGLERSRPGPGYAPPGALGLDLHTVAITVTPTSVGKSPLVTVEPANDAVRLAVEARTTAPTTGTITVSQLDDTAFRVNGNIAAGTAPTKQRFALRHPERFAGEVLATVLRQQQIVIQGTVRSGTLPPTAKTLTTISAPSLPQLLREMNLNSLNVVADNLLLTLGAERFGSPGTVAKGSQAVREFLAKLDLPVNEVTVVDGSGLSRENRVSTSFMARYLTKISGQSWFEQFHASLSRAGLEGTARTIGYRNERFRVKTGILEDVFALAGYGVNSAGHNLAFAVIVNMPGAAQMDVQQYSAEVMRFLTDTVIEGIQ